MPSSPSRYAQPPSQRPAPGHQHGLSHLRLAELLAADQRHQQAALSAARAKQLRPNDTNVASLLARLSERPRAGDGAPTRAIDPAPERH